MHISPLDIRHREFSKRYKGYDNEEVRNFLNSVSSTMEKLIHENNQLKLELKRRDQQLQDYISREKALQDTMLTAQKMLEDIKISAEKEAQAIISSAELQAEEVVANSQRRLMKVIDDINEMKRQRVKFEAEVRSIIEQHLKLLDTLMESEAETAEMEDKLKFLTSKREKDAQA